MEFSSALYVFLVSSLIAVSSADSGNYDNDYDSKTPRYETCSDVVTKCIKEINGGYYPASYWGYIGEGWLHKTYYMMWGSCQLASDDDITCLSTKRKSGGAEDYYWNKCNITKKIEYKEKLDSKTSIFSITGYEDKSMKGYSFYGGKSCWGHWYCSNTGLVRPHYRIMCNTKSYLDHKAEIDEAISKAKKCNLGDGAPSCGDSC